jgi:hypothetical protein
MHRNIIHAGRGGCGGKEENKFLSIVQCALIKWTLRYSSRPRIFVFCNFFYGFFLVFLGDFSTVRRSSLLSLSLLLSEDFSSVGQESNPEDLQYLETSRHADLLATPHPILPTHHTVVNTFIVDLSYTLLYWNAACFVEKPAEDRDLIIIHL